MNEARANWQLIVVVELVNSGIVVHDADSATATTVEIVSKKCHLSDFIAENKFKSPDSKYHHFFLDKLRVLKKRLILIRDVLIKINELTEHLNNENTEKFGHFFGKVISKLCFCLL